MIALRLLFLSSLISLPLHSSAPKQKGGPSDQKSAYEKWDKDLCRARVPGNTQTGIEIMFYAGTLAQNDERNALAQQQLEATQQQNDLLSRLLACLVNSQSQQPAATTGPKPTQNADGTWNFSHLFSSPSSTSQGATTSAAIQALSDHKSSN